MEYSPLKMKNRLEKHGFDFKKKFGQNFIIDENIINSIVSKAEIDDKTLVIEIGPGAGSLTDGIAKKAKNVLCYEIDTTLETLLNEIKEDHSNVDVVFKDFLQANVKEDIKNYDYDKLFVVANLPYYITTPIIVKLIEDEVMPEKIIIMVQKEVGDRFNAKPKTKDYGSLTVFLNYYYKVRKLIDVSRNVFIPKPNVDSIVVEFSKLDDNFKLKNKELFFKLVRDSFKQKRKTLRNNLKGYDLEKIETVLAKFDLTLQVRAEAMPIEIFVEIANELA